MQQVTVRVPASTSNLGPGFDCLGLALRIYNDVTVSRGRTADRDSMAARAGEKFFEIAQRKPFSFRCAVGGDVPSSRGLGSSVTVRLGALIALNELSGRPLPREQLFDICAALEGHPDNAAPAAFGGFNIIAGGEHQRFAVAANLRVVLLVSAFQVRTDEARRLLPAAIPHADAVANSANVARIVAAFVAQRYNQLRGAFADRIHQPFRKHLVPRFDEIIAAAECAGALGGFLSGSGSTIAVMTLRSPDKIAAAMLANADAADARTIITSADNRGARIVAA
jgi:homoserine kinase